MNRREFIKNMTIAAGLSCVPGVLIAKPTDSTKHFVSDDGKYTLDISYECLHDVSEYIPTVEKDIQAQLNVLKYKHYMEGRYTIVVSAVNKRISLKHSVPRYELYNEIAKEAQYNLYESVEIAQENMEKCLKSVCTRAVNENIVYEAEPYVNVSDDSIQVQFAFREHEGSEFRVAEFNLCGVGGKFDDIVA